MLVTHYQSKMSVHSDQMISLSKTSLKNCPLLRTATAPLLLLLLLLLWLCYCFVIIFAIIVLFFLAVVVSIVFFGYYCCCWLASYCFYSFFQEKRSYAAAVYVPGLNLFFVTGGVTQKIRCQCYKLFLVKLCK